MKKSDILRSIFALVSIILGIMIIIYPNMLDGYMRFVALVALVSGIFDIMIYCQNERYTDIRSMIILVCSIVIIMCAISLFVYPGSNITVLALVIPLWLLAHHIAKVADLSIRHKDIKERIAIIVDVISIILCIFMFIMPYISFGFSELVISIDIILMGIEMILTLDI